MGGRQRPTKAIALMGGDDPWSNGIDLTVIEAAPDPARESWRNINAMDDLVRDIITTSSHLTCAAVAGNAGAGGAILALAADLVFSRDGVVLDPHYRTMHLLRVRILDLPAPSSCRRGHGPRADRAVPASQCPNR